MVVPGVALIPYDFVVVFIDDQGNPTSNQVMGVPCVRLNVVAASGPDSSIIKHEAVWFLVDTGADFVYMLGAIINRLNAPLVPNASVNVMDSATQSNVHRVGLGAPDGKWQRVWDVIATDFVGHHAQLGGILGRRFLIECEQAFNGPSHSFTLRHTGANAP